MAVSTRYRHQPSSSTLADLALLLRAEYTAITNPLSPSPQDATDGMFGTVVDGSAPPAGPVAVDGWAEALLKQTVLPPDKSDKEVVLKYLASINDTSFGRSARDDRARMIQSLPVETIAGWLRGERYDRSTARQRQVRVDQHTAILFYPTSSPHPSSTTADEDMFKCQVLKARDSASGSLRSHKKGKVYAKLRESKTDAQMNKYNRDKLQDFWNTNMTKHLAILG